MATLKFDRTDLIHRSILWLYYSYRLYTVNLISLSILIDVTRRLQNNSRTKVQRIAFVPFLEDVRSSGAAILIMCDILECVFAVKSLCLPMFRFHILSWPKISCIVIDYKAGLR